VENAQIADIFETIADLIDLQGGNEFRVRSYHQAARTVRDHPDRLEDLAEEGADFTDLPNIGESTAKKIHEILDTGTCARLEELREEMPERLTELMNIPSVGPRKAKEMHDELGIDSLDDLRKACEEGKVRHLPGLGEKTEQKILEGLETLETTAGRILLSEAEDHVRSLGRHLDSLSALNRWEVAGSFRRRKETVGDLDILVQASDRSEAADQILDHDDVADVISKGKERISVRLGSGLQADFRFFETEAFGAALLYFTGSKAHNIKLRRRAQDRDWKLNEYGLLKGDRRLAGKDEESVYHRLNLAWIPPELREDRGEIEAADEEDLPDLIKPDDLRGDLQCHTEASDGADSIQDMADAARDLGHRFLAITDHSKAVRVANGLDEDRLKKHADRIRKVDGKRKDFWLLAGVEVDILKHGALDLEEDVLADLDWVVASVHSHMELDRDEMTDRLVKAIESGVIHCLGHPFGRILGKRKPMQFDTERVFGACAEHDVFVEINAQPDRLDLPDAYCREAKEAGARFSIGTDAHKMAGLKALSYGVNVARRGWLEKGDVVNTKTIKQLRKVLKRS
jgi:DNA polymerase (family 10)